jgi:hypothetical protein
VSEARASRMTDDRLRAAMRLGVVAWKWTGVDEVDLVDRVGR